MTRVALQLFLYFHLMDYISTYSRDFPNSNQVSGTLILPMCILLLKVGAQMEFSKPFTYCVLVVCFFFFSERS